MSTLKKIGKNISIFVGINFISICVYIQYKKNSSSKLNIVLDLDETIIHTDKKNNYNNFNKVNILKPYLVDLTYKSSSTFNTNTNINTNTNTNINTNTNTNINLNANNDTITTRVVWIRPGVNLLLPLIAQFNNVYLFTKAKKTYTDEILLKTDLNKYFIEKKYRDECVGTCKDLEKFNIKIDKSILIDDKLSNRCDGQNFYHIPRFNCYTTYDYKFFKLFGYIVWLNILDDLGLNKTR